MATFAFLVDFEEGHLFPSFGLSKSLKARGHVVHYIGIADIRKSVEEQGFQFHPILENQYPEGFREKFKKEHLNKIHYSKVNFLNCIEHELALLFDDIKPVGVIISTYLSLEALLIHYRHKITPVIFMPVINSHVLNECRHTFESLRSGQFDLFHHYRRYDSSLKNKIVLFLRKFFSSGKKISRNEFREFISPLERFGQMIACPVEFELPGEVRSKVHYIGPCIRLKTNVSNEFIQHLKQKNKKIIYVSLGSQTERIHQACEALYLKIIDIMRDPELADYHVVLSSASAHNLRDSISIPGNMDIVAWIDALDILEIASAIITHGGLGLIKESIYYGVPMIILPDKYDQPLNAQRVVYHQLGVQDDLINITRESLKSHLLKVTTDPVIKEKLQQMKTVFRKTEELHEGAILLEKIFGIKPVADETINGI